MDDNTKQDQNIPAEEPKTEEVSVTAIENEPETVETNLTGDEQDISSETTVTSEASETLSEESNPVEPTIVETKQPESISEKSTIEQTMEAVAASEEPSSDETSSTAPVAPVKNDVPGARWYVVHTYSGHENKVAATLKQRIDSEHLEKNILEVLVPMQDKIEIKSGKKSTIKEKIFPGYILVKMVLDDISWLAVRTTQGVTSFVGMGNKPTPISDSEVATIVKFTQTEAPVYKQVFSADDAVKIVDGPFADFIGKVDSVDEERGKVKVLVSIFGRETPVELDFLQIQKI